MGYPKTLAQDEKVSYHSYLNEGRLWMGYFDPWLRNYWWSCSYLGWPIYRHGLRSICLG
ncbi:hypothetical protein Hanom_Chr10g00880351 [Helianthus anomalus]